MRILCVCVQGGKGERVRERERERERISEFSLQLTFSHQAEVKDTESSS